MRRLWSALLCAFCAFGIVGIVTNAGDFDEYTRINHDLSVCQHSGAVHCHTEVDTDGITRVYGRMPTTTTTAPPVVLAPTQQVWQAGPQEDSDATLYALNQCWAMYAHCDYAHGQVTGTAAKLPG